MNKYILPVALFGALALSACGKEKEAEEKNDMHQAPVEKEVPATASTPSEPMAPEHHPAGEPPAAEPTPFAPAPSSPPAAGEEASPEHHATETIPTEPMPTTPASEKSEH